jgi:hypothetical protein
VQVVVVVLVSLEARIVVLVVVLVGAVVGLVVGRIAILFPALLLLQVVVAPLDCWVVVVTKVMVA